MGTSFEFCRDASLPRLSWLAVLRKGDPTIRVIHGDWVETGEGFFMEGAWDGHFPDGAIHKALALAGSGGKLTNQGALFCAPFHTLGRVHVLKDPAVGLTFVSNSFAVCLVASGHSLRLDYPLYWRDLYSIVLGTGAARRHVPLTDGRIYLVYARNIEVGTDGTMKFEDKALPPAFSSFRDYYAFLVDTLKAIAINAASEDLQVRYRLLATVSSGYDSPACAAIGLHVGCREAVTLEEPEQRHGGGDSGREIASYLGPSVTSANGSQYRDRSDLVEAEFFASDVTGEDVRFAAFEEVFQGRILLTGFHGDTIWAPHKQPSIDIKRGDVSGTSLEEFRLRTGFVNLPVPFLGALRHPDIHGISNSPEMRPWRLGRSYDRPIPRRIVEEAGVPRGLFGQRKRVQSVLFISSVKDDPDSMSRMMSDASREDYASFFESHYRRTRLEVWYHALHLLRSGVHHFLMRINGTLLWLNLPLVRFHPLESYKTPMGKNWLVFHWGVEHTRSRYSTSVIDSMTH